MLSQPRPELLSALPHDRSLRLQPNADAASLVDIGALGGNRRAFRKDAAINDKASSLSNRLGERPRTAK
jgi:hypothetical protein